MRGKSSPKQGSSKAAGMDINKVDKLNEEPHLSGAYIRNLVKQLTSTRSKDPSSNESELQENPDAGEGLSPVENGGKEEPLQPPPPPPQHKKQVRRRLHTSKPYQERLLNMAEARREIVTALKFHRAAMKQQQQQQQPHPQQQQPEIEMQETHQLQEVKSSKSKRNSRISASNFDNPHFTSYGNGGGDLHLSCYSSSSSSSSSGFNSCPFSYPYNYPWPLPPSVNPPPLFNENLNIPLPNQPLGLNLNFQDFNIDSNCTMFSNSTTSPSSSSSPPPMCFPIEEVIPQQEVIIPMVCGNYDDESNMVINNSEEFHYAMDDKELAEVRSVGEQHQIEWNDTMNLVNSAWWSKFLKSLEIDDPQENYSCEDNNYGKLPFDENVEFPSWLNSNESLLEDYCCSDDYMKDAALPCMEIEEIEGIEGDWLSS